MYADDQPYDAAVEEEMNDEEQMKYMETKLENLEREERKGRKERKITEEEEKAQEEVEITFEAYAKLMDDMLAAEELDKELANEEYDEARFREEVDILAKSEREEDARRSSQSHKKSVR